MIKRTISLTTDASGNATEYASSALGVLYAVQLVDGTFDDGVDLTLTSEAENLSIALLTIADWNTDRILYPRVLEALNTDGSALTSHCHPVISGRIKAVIAQGGNVKTGSVVLYIAEL